FSPFLLLSLSQSSLWALGRPAPPADGVRRERRIGIRRRGGGGDDDAGAGEQGGGGGSCASPELPMTMRLSGGQSAAAVSRWPARRSGGASGGTGAAQGREAAARSAKGTASRRGVIREASSDLAAAKRCVARSETNSVRHLSHSSRSISPFMAGSMEAVAALSLPGGADNDEPAPASPLLFSPAGRRSSVAGPPLLSRLYILVGVASPVIGHQTSRRGESERERKGEKRGKREMMWHPDMWDSC
ncbi:Os09g0428750, partial [Oryza sativa Japonica Group]